MDDVSFSITDIQPDNVFWALWDSQPDDRYYVTRLDGRSMLHRSNQCCDEVGGKVGNVSIIGPFDQLEEAAEFAQNKRGPTVRCEESLPD